MDINGASVDVLNGYLKDAGLYNSTAVKQYPSIGDVFTQFDNVSDFTTSNGLTAGGFSILWAPHWNANIGITAAERDAVTQKISAFIDAGHPFLAQCAAIAAFEGSADQSSGGYDIGGNKYGFFITNGTNSAATLKTNKLAQPNFPSTSSEKIVVNPDTTLRAWADPLAQTGDFVLDVNGVTSYMLDFQPATGFSFDSYVKTYVQSSTSSSTTNKLPIETVAYKDGDSSKGLIIYLGGHSYGSDTSSGCSSGHCVSGTQFNMIGLERLVLNSLIFLGQIPTSSEQTRSAPITTANGKTYLGSYVQQSSATASFPPWNGHFREYPAGALAGTNVQSFNSITSNWDSYERVKIQAASDRRTIYSAVSVAGKWVQKAFTTANAASFGLTTTVMSSIRTGGLGGVDHSIPAIIGPSSVAGSPTRPTIAYFGALDGMIHAVQVSGSGTGVSNGDELWAFIPPSQLAKVVAQTSGVDGSPSVGDAFVDTGSGTRSWRTLLAIPDGNYANGTLDVIDVTDPLNPQFLWEASDSFTSGGKTYVLGRAQGAAIAPIKSGAGTRFAYFVATDNTNGTAGNGFNAYALDAGTGAVIWRYNKLFSYDTTHNDVPGTVVAIDASGSGGTASNVFFGDIEGRVWNLPAATGPTTTPTAIFDAPATYATALSVNYPIESGVVVYRDPTTSNLQVMGVTSGADWVPAATLTKVFRYDVKTTTATTLATLASGERVYAVPTVSGNNAYFITSMGNLQTAIGNSFTATGNLVRISLGATPTMTTLATVKQGASEVAVDGNGNIIAVSATGITQNGNSGVDKSQATVALQNAAQKLMSVRAWFDFR
jgi:hypothetical protein